MKRLFYLGYYLKGLDRAKLDRFMDHVQREFRKSKPALWVDIIYSSLRYNISILEYFNFHFYKSSAKERSTWAGTGFMYEYQLKMNPKEHREVLENKLLFLKNYAPFVRHQYADLSELKLDPEKARRLLENPSGKIVMKSSDGQCGWGVEVRSADEFTPESLVARMQETGNDLAEEFVSQHPKLMELSPSGLNTLRLITQLNHEGEVTFLGARLRISVNSHVDNLAAGNLAAPVDLESGMINGPAVYSDITKGEASVHPVTGVPIVGFQIPYWEESLKLAREAAMVVPENRSIGWDVAITEKGPELIEGNHNWCKLLWQLPVKKGLKQELQQYL